MEGRQATTAQFANARATIEGLERTRDTLLWRLEASAHEIAAILAERLGTERYLADIDYQLGELRAQEGEGCDEDDAGYSGGGGGGAVDGPKGDGGDAEGENELEEIDEAVDQLQE